MAKGTLRKGFTIHTSTNHSIAIPKNTEVRMFKRQGSPTVVFADYDIECVRVNSTWYAIICGEPVPMIFPDGGDVPYPLSYFK